MAFVTISRFANKRILTATNAFFYRMPALSSSSSAIIQDESYESRNVRLNRPMSPSLSVYKMALPTTVSISHRITGCMISAYAVAFGAAALTMPLDFENYMTAIEAFKPNAFAIMSGKFMIAFPFMFHTCNGMRHLVWDTGRVLNKQTLVTTSATVLAASIISTLIVMYI